MYDQPTIERIIEEVTREVILRLDQAAGQTSVSSTCNCTDGSCVANCPTHVDKVVEAGASRVT